MARYIYFHGGTGYPGCDFEDIMEYPDNTTDDTLYREAEERAIENGESYEYLATGWDGDFESEDDRDWYYQDCWCDWTEITKEEYDKKREEEGL